jgi:tRNA pseudouridine13 synthase
LKGFSETEIGIAGYTTSGEGIPGHIKDSPADFIVDEIPLDFPRDPNGKYLHIKVRLTNWDTNHFLGELAGMLRISRKRISYAGTKDKRGVTTQWFCINADVSDIQPAMKDVEVIEQYRSPAMIRLGDLLGNRFSIRIEANANFSDRIMSISRDLSEAGFINFFGPQRFGAQRPITHRVGKLLLMGKYEDAVDEYICDPAIDTEWFRLEYEKSRDAREALKNFPLHLSNERVLLQKILEGRKSEAFDYLPMQLKMLFVHAYQSYIFNRIVSKRFEVTRSVLETQIGDVCVPADGFGNPGNDQIKVTPFNQQKIAGLVRSGKAAITAPLPGYESAIEGGLQGDIERELLEMEMISHSSFSIEGHPELSSKGSRRSISGVLADFQSSDGNWVSFALGKGMYATSVMREFLRNPDMTVYSGP